MDFKEKVDDITDVDVDEIIKNKNVELINNPMMLAMKILCLILVNFW